MPTCYLVRHAMPQMPYAERYDVPPGPGLSDAGREQAVRTGKFLAGQGITRLYHSPLARAVQTAAIVANHLHRPSREAEGLAEWRREETAEQVQERVARFWETLLDGQDGAVALISHAGPIEQLLRFLSREQVDLASHSYWGRATTPPGGVWQARAGAADGPWEMAMIFDPESYL